MGLLPFASRPGQPSAATGDGVRSEYTNRLCDRPFLSPLSSPATVATLAGPRREKRTSPCIQLSTHRCWRRDLSTTVHSVWISRQGVEAATGECEQRCSQVICYSAL